MKRAGVICVLLLLAACGFEPVYGTRDKTAPTEIKLSQVAIDMIPDREGQILRNYLIDRMYGRYGRPKDPTYHLSVQITYGIQDLGIRANATSTRTQLSMYGNYSLLDLKGKKVMSGSARSLASYNKLTDQYASLAAKENAFQRTLNEVSEQIVNRVSLYLAEQPDAADQKIRRTIAR